MKQIQYSSQDIYDVFSCAGNLNSALKNFLKREVRKGDPTEKFVKTFRKVSSTGNSTAIKAFFDKSLPEYAQHLLLLAGYANANIVNIISEEIIEKHADAFNETYEEGENGITITDEKAFKTIVEEVSLMLNNGLKQHKLPETDFMRLVMVNSIFEEQVTEKVAPLMFH